MTQLTIKELEHLSGIRAHTIRAWESRYSLLSPARTGGNMRTYTLVEAELLLCTALLVRQGQRISEVAAMAPDVLFQQVAFLESESLRKARRIHELILALLAADLNRFERLLATATRDWGTDGSIKEVIYPLAEAAGLIWNRRIVPGLYRQLALQVLQRKLWTAIDVARSVCQAQPVVLLFHCPGEMSDLTLTYAHYLLACSGLAPVQTGEAVTGVQLLEIARRLQPRFLMTYCTVRRRDGQLPTLLQALRQQLPDSELILLGDPARRRWHQRYDRVHCTGDSFNALPLLTGLDAGRDTDNFSERADVKRRNDALV